MRLIPESLMFVKKFRGMTYRDIAPKVYPEIAKSAVGRYARGEKEVYDKYKIELLAAALDVPLTCLITLPPKSTDKIAQEALAAYNNNYWNRGWNLLIWLYALHGRDTYIRATQIGTQVFRYHAEKVRYQQDNNLIDYGATRRELKELKQRIRILEARLE